MGFRSWEHRCGRAFCGVVPAVSAIALEARARHNHGIETVRKRTQAKQRSERESGGVPKPSLEDGRQVVDVIRKNSTARHHAHGSGAGVTVGGGTTPVLPPVIEQPPPPAVHAMTMHLPSPAPSFTTAGISQSTSVHAGRPRCQLGSPPPSRTNSPSYARPAGRPTGQRPDLEGVGVLQVNSS